MSNTNKKQIDGTHYKERKYQHWDWVGDINLHYYLACSSKYITRWKDKNGIYDLEKSIHYLEKAKERGIQCPPLGTQNRLTLKFVNQLSRKEATIILYMVCDAYDDAIDEINQLIEAEEDRIAQQEIIDTRKRDGV